MTGEEIECRRCASTNDYEESPNAANCITEFHANDKVKCPADSYCYVYNDKRIIRRGCIGKEDKFVKEKKFCDENKEICVSCSEKSFCNELKLELDECFQVEYDKTNLPSQNNWPPSVKCPIGSLKPLGCYHMEKNDIVKRGCVSNLDEEAQKNCKNDKNCKICIGQKCNSKVTLHRECTYCDESVKGKNCAESSELLSSKTDCSDVSNSCLVGVDANGYTHRICAKQGDNAKKFPKGFEICHNDLCNDKTYPMNRMKCFQCEGDNADCPLQTPESKQKLNSKVCEIFADKDQCYTYIADGKLVHLFIHTRQ